MKKLFTHKEQKLNLFRPNTLTRRLMIPLALLVVFTAFGMALALFKLHQHYLHDTFSKNIAEVDSNMQTLLNEQASSLALTLKVIASDPNVQEALRHNDSRALLHQWQNTFQKMKESNKLSHFYFLDKHRVCLLRVHNPGKKGDLIDRFTAQEAEWHRDISSGIEVGAMGMLTLRTVQPVIVDNELLGYVEMGKEIEDVLHMLHVQSDIDLIMVLHKKGLNKDQWEEGMRLLNREPNWALFPSDVLIYSSFEKLPDTFSSYMRNKLSLQQKHENLDEELESNANSYRIANLSVKDISGKEVGDLFVVQNVTNTNLAFFDIGSIIALIGGLFTSFILGFIYQLLKRTDENITHQHETIVESQQRLEELSQHSRTIAWEVDSDGKYTYVSDVVYDVLGYTRKEIVGMHFYDLHPLAEREEFKNAAFEVIKRKEPFSNFKNCAERKDGKLIWLMTNGLPLLAPDGRLLGYRGNDTDITEWKNAEDQIIESRNLLNTIIDTIPIRVFWKNKYLRYMGCNTLFARDAGLEDPSDLIGKDDYQLGWRDQAEIYRADDRAVIESGESKLFYEEDQTTPDGNTIWLSTSKIPLKNKDGSILGVLGIYEDITKQKEMQEDLRLNAKMLNDAQHVAHMGSWALDLINDSLIGSEEVFRIFEQNSQHFTPTYAAFFNLVHPEDREMVNNAYMTSLSSQQPYEITHRLLMDDGRIKWVHESGISDFDEQGKPLRSIGTVQDITERKSAEEEINRLAFFDTLTQLPNKTLFMERLNQMQGLYAANHQFGALLFIDLDHFKTLNDTLGHAIGDMLLKQSAKRLLECVRDGDTIARLGGDEFVILLANIGLDEKYAASLCEQIAKKILVELNKPYLLDEINYQSTASVGITLFNSDRVSSDELMKQADLAMYQSKEMGRNTLSFFDPEMEKSLKDRALLEEEMRRGIEERQFSLYYQPQVYNNGEIYGVEALIRWNHPTRGMVSPLEFIPLAEETGLIIPLGEWILETACEQIKQWSQQNGFETFSISVNVSARQFNQNNFVDSVVKIIKEYSIDPKLLKLELTESLLVQNIENVIEKMETLKEYGITFSLDDFGTGYSSLAYLKRLPLDQLKIDQGFVRDILSDTNDTIICKSTIALGHSMGLSVIAEGVETQEQLSMLKSFGCGAYQGYYFSRPLSVEAFEAYCITNKRL